MSDVSSGDPVHPADPGPGAGQRLVVVGQGRIGLPLALRAVAAGYEVVGYDRRASRVRRLAEGDPQLSGIPPEALAAAMATGRYTVTASDRDCAGFDIAVIAEPTPLRAGAPDLTAIDSTVVETSAVTLAPLLRAGCLVILETTTYPGTTDQLLVPTLELVSGLEAGADFSVGYSPESVDQDSISASPPGRPARPVAGVDSRATERIGAFYASLGDETVAVAQIRDAELAKLMELTLQHGNSVMIEWLALLAADLGLDAWALPGPGVADGPAAVEPAPGPGAPDRPRDAGSSADLARLPFLFDAEPASDRPGLRLRS